MSLIDLSAEQHPPPGLSLNLSSNNPFRQGTASPAFPSPNTPGFAPPRPTPRNPFLDSNSLDVVAKSMGEPAQRSLPQKMASANEMSGAPKLTGNTADLFSGLSLDDQPKPSASKGRMGPPRSVNNFEKSKGGPSRPENVPPRPESSRHRPSRSQEEAMRAKKAASSSRRAPSRDLDIFADPNDSPKRSDSASRRRNSESSTIRKPETDEERRRRRREREKRHREREGKDPKTRRLPKNLDIIDKLDVTSIYGTGLFHHDGPFDACNPHRNRQGSQRAPMQAFPKDSLNNIMGGGGPLNKRPDHAAFLGHNDDEAFKDYSSEAFGNGGLRNDDAPRAGGAAVTVVNPKGPEVVYGDESLGLGASTFLEGTPASREAIARRQQASNSDGAEGLQRKKSLAQKIRGIRNEKRDYNPSGRVTSPSETVTSPGSPFTPGITPGGTRGRAESNPFASEFSFSSSNAERKLEGLSFTEPERLERLPGQGRAPPSSPKRFNDGLQRCGTNDGSEEPAKQTGGFLSRVKSLKGGPRKPRDPSLI